VECRLQEKATGMRDDPGERTEVLIMMRKLKTADNEVTAWRQLLSEIMKTDRVDLEGFVTARRDKVGHNTTQRSPGAEWAFGTPLTVRV